MRILFYFVILLSVGILNVAQAENPKTSTLEGRILYHEQIPPTETLNIKQDKKTCGATRHITAVSVSSDGGLAQVIVSIEGLGEIPLSPKQEPLIINNAHCRFQPPIGVGLVKQFVEVRNTDPILHNTHIRTKTRAFFNVVLLPQAKGFQKAMKKSGLMTVACNKHPFMKGFIRVFDHPYYAITDTQGAFTIPNLPPGTHTLSLWHETLGTLEQTITLPQKDGTLLNIEFPAP